MGIPLSSLVCNASLLGRYLSAGEGDATATADLQGALCGLQPDTLRQAERLFLSQLDLSKVFTVRWRAGGGGAALGGRWGGF